MDENLPAKRVELSHELRTFCSVLRTAGIFAMGAEVGTWVVPGHGLGVLAICLVLTARYLQAEWSR